MSRTIENDVVKMTFDNGQFEKGCKESMSTIEKLKSALDFSGSVKGVDELNKSVKNIDFTPVQNNFQKVTSWFDEALDQIKTGIYRAFGEDIQNTIKNFVDSITDIPIKQIGVGWDKFEEKTQSVQTIMAALQDTIKDDGDRLSYVNSQIEKLNWFTDETSYSLSDMTNNISKFTSNGIKLKTATTAMIGIANAAGMAGTSTQNASHAMEGFSKAMGEGYMSKQNWQWIKTARMDTEKFKQTIIDTAVELKKLNDGDVTIASFESSLSDKWMTNDITLAALAKYGEFSEEIYEEYKKTGKLTSEILDDVQKAREEVGEEMSLGEQAFKMSQEAKTWTDSIQSVRDAVSTSWMRTFEYIFGDYIQAKKLWTTIANELYDVFMAGSEYRNNILKGWNLAGGWEEMFGTEGEIGAAIQIWYNFTDILYAIEDAISELMPDTETMTRMLLNATSYAKRFASAMALSEDALTGLKNAAKMALSVLKPLGTALAFVGKVFINVALVINVALDMILASFASIENIPSLFERIFGEERWTRLTAAFDKIGQSLSNLKDAVLNKLADVDLSPLGNMLLNIKNLVIDLGGFILDLIVAGFEKLAEIDFSKFADSISTAIGAVVGLISKIDLDKIISKIVTGLEVVLDLLGPIGDSIRNFFSGFKIGQKYVSSFSKEIANAHDKVSNFYNSTFGKLFTKKVSSAGKALTDFADTATGNIDKIDNKTNTLSKDLVNRTESAASQSSGIISSKLGSVFDDVKSAASGIFSGLFGMTAYADEGTAGTFYFVEEAEKGLTEYAEAAEDTSKTVSESVTEIANNQTASVDEMVNATTTSMTGLNTSLSEILSNVGGFAQSAWEWIKKFVGEITIGSVIVFAAGIAIVKLITAITKRVETGTKKTNELVDALTEGFKSWATLGTKLGTGVTDITSSISGVFKELTAIGKAYESSLSNRGWAMVILSVAALIGAIVVAFKVLETIDTTQMQIMVLQLGAILLETFVFITILAGLQAACEKFKIESVTKAFVELAAALAILGLVVQRIGSLTPDQLNQGTETVMGMMLFMTIFGALFGVIQKYAGGFQDFSKSMLLMAGAIALMVVPVAALGIIPFWLLFKGIVALGFILKFFQGFAAATQFVTGLQSKNLALFIADMMLLDVAVSLMVIPIAALSLIPKAMLEKGMNAVAGILLAFWAFSELLEMVDSTGMNQQLGQFCTSMILLAVAINLLVLPIAAIGLLAKIDVNIVEDGIAFVGGMMAFMVIMASWLSKTDNLTSSLVSFGACMALLAVALNLMILPIGIMGILITKFYPIVLAGTTFVAGFMAFFWGLALLFNEVTELKSSLISFGACMTLLAVAMNLLTLPIIALGAAVKHIGFLNTLGGAVVIGVIMGFFYAFAKGLEKVSTINMGAVLKFSGVMLVLSVAITAIAGVIALMTMLDTATMLMAAGALSAVVLALSYSLKAMGGFKFNASAVAGLVLGVAAMGAVAYALYQFKDITNDNMIQIATGLGIVMVAICAALAILGNADMKTLAGAGSLVIAAAGVVALAYAFQMMSAVPAGQLTEAAQAIAIAIAVIGTAALILGTFWQAGLIGAGVLAVLGAVFLEFAYALTVFGESLAAIAQGIELLAQIAPVAAQAGQAIADFASTAITSFVTGIINGVPQIAAALGYAFATVQESFILGFTQGKIDILDAAVDVFGGFVEKVKSIFGIKGNGDSTEMSEIGDNVGSTLTNKLSGWTKKLFGTGEDLGNAVGEGVKEPLMIHSPSKLMKWVADMIGEGLVDELKSKWEGIVGDEGSILGQLLSGNFLESAMIDTDELMSQYDLSGITDGIEDEVAEASSSASTSSSGTKKDIKTTAELVKTYSRGSSAIQKFIATYGELMETETEGIDVAKTAKDAVDEFVIKLYEESGNTIEATGDLYEDAISRFEAMAEAYDDFCSSLKSSISNVDLFSELEEQEEIAAGDMLERMADQYANANKWADNLASLAERGLSTGLMKMLIDKGPTEYQYVDAFVNMTKEQLEEANTIYDEKTFLSDNIADKVVAAYAKNGIDAADAFSEGLKAESEAMREQYGLDLQTWYAQNATMGMPLDQHPVLEVKDEYVEDAEEVGTAAGEALGESVVQSVTKALKDENGISTMTTFYKNILDKTGIITAMRHGGLFSKSSEMFDKIDIKSKDLTGAFDKSATVVSEDAKAMQNSIGAMFGKAAEESNGVEKTFTTNSGVVVKVLEHDENEAVSLFSQKCSEVAAKGNDLTNGFTENAETIKKSATDTFGDVKDTATEVYGGIKDGWDTTCTYVNNEVMTPVVDSTQAISNLNAIQSSYDSLKASLGSYSSKMLIAFDSDYVAQTSQAVLGSEMEKLNNGQVTTQELLRRILSKNTDVYLDGDLVGGSVNSYFGKQTVLAGRTGG